MLKLKNTLSGKLEEFVPLTPDKVGMYNCGPTVYNYAHIGNLRSYVFADTLKRALIYLGYEVDQVINITDVGHLSSDADEGEDKMTKALRREGKPLTTDSMREVANFYFEEFKKDLKRLNILPPNHFPFASDHLNEDVKLIQTLLEKGFAYQTKDGIYFDTEKDAGYGKLGGLTPVDEEHARITANTEKKNPRDFALWKFNNELGYESSLGKGFPGWHIECSAMAMKYLGETFDIHTGGIDHIPVHHNNEIAQSENATGESFARYWLHNAFVNVDGGKMAKSEDNFLSLQVLIDKNILPIAYRYWLLQARYSTPVNFSLEALEAAQQAYIKIIKLWQTLPDGGSVDQKYKGELLSAIEDDLDTPKAIALLWELVKDTGVHPADKKATLREFDKVLGLNLDHIADVARFTNQPIDKLPEEIQALIARREEVRKQKDFATSDSLREELKQKGYEVEDKPDGPNVYLLR